MNAKEHLRAALVELNRKEFWSKEMTVPVLAVKDHIRAVLAEFNRNESRTREQTTDPGCKYEGKP